jgi:hypothetical protein
MRRMMMMMMMMIMMKKKKKQKTRMYSSWLNYFKQKGKPPKLTKVLHLF